MILIADSGSTKTDWRWIDDRQNICQYSTRGINPNHLDKKDIEKIIRDELISQLNEDVNLKNIYFYGAGCGSEEKNEVLRSVLSGFFGTAAILVDNDLLGAAKALCGDQKGIVAILGTGSNTCYYNGKSIERRIGGWGYILGDEGSGAHLGMRLIKDYLNDDVPIHLKSKLEETFQLNKEKIVNAVYKEPEPNRFLSSFSKFIGDNISEKYTVSLVRNCFDLFFEKHICKYPKNETGNINFVGSVAFHFSSLLKESAKANGFEINNIIKAPINNLVAYHTNEVV